MQPSPATAQVRVRRADISDLDALEMLEQCSFDGDRMSRAQYRRHLASDSARVLIAHANRRHLLGSAVVFFRKRSGVARLYSLARRPEARGQGIGAVLVEAAEAAARQRRCRALRLEVRADNQAAIALYQRMGYQRIGFLEGYYEDGANGWRYEKLLL